MSGVRTGLRPPPEELQVLVALLLEQEAHTAHIEHEALGGWLAQPVLR